jgi:hypothetical protein
MRRLSTYNSNMEKEKQTRFHVWLLYPVLVLAVVFAVDKALLLLPKKVQNAGLALNETAKIRLDNEASFAARKPGTRSVVVFGSSRSERFNLLKQETRLSAYLTERQKSQIMATQFLVYAQVGAQMAPYYHGLDHLWRRGFIPDAIVIELGGELFELDHKNNHGKSEFLFSDEYDFEYYLHLFRYGKKSVRDEAFSRLMFASYAMKPRPELLVFDYRGTPKEPEPEYSIIERYVRSYQDYLDAELTGDLRDKRIGQFLTMYGNNYRSFRLDPLMDASLKKVLELARAKRVPVLLFKPFVHPELKAVLDKTPYAAMVDQYARELSGGGVKYYVVDQNNYQCKYWLDVSYFSTRCTPEVMHHLLRQLDFFPAD